MPSITVNIPEPKVAAGQDVLLQKRDRSFDRLIAKLDRMSDRAPIKEDTRLLQAMTRLQKTVEASWDIEPLQRALDKQWKSLKSQGKPATTATVRLPQAFYDSVDQLEAAVARPLTAKISPELGRKIDVLTAAVLQSRPKTFGVMR